MNREVPVHGGNDPPCSNIVEVARQKLIAKGFSIEEAEWMMDLLQSSRVPDISLEHFNADRILVQVQRSKTDGGIEIVTIKEKRRRTLAMLNFRNPVKKMA